MPNMSYCRFSNTLSDLKDCEEALCDGLESLSNSERESAERLIKLCKRIADDFSEDD